MMERAGNSNANGLGALEEKVRAAIEGALSELSSATDGLIAQAKASGLTGTGLRTVEKACEEALEISRRARLKEVGESIARAARSFGIKLEARAPMKRRRRAQVAPETKNEDGGKVDPGGTPWTSEKS